MSFVDFAELKSRMSIEEAVKLLDLDMKPRGDQLRSACPVCGGGERTLVVTPAKSVYFCFKDGKGGDMIALAAHIRQETVKEAAIFLSGTKVALTSTSKNRTSDTSPEERAPNQTKKLDSLSNLDCEHEGVIALGLDTTVTKRLGIGFRTKGAGQGSVLIPVRNQDGEVEGWLGVQELTYIPKDFAPPENVVQFKRKA